MIYNWISSGDFLGGLRFNELIGFSQYYQEKSSNNNSSNHHWPANDIYYSETENVDSRTKKRNARKTLHSQNVRVSMKRNNNNNSHNQYETKKMCKPIQRFWIWLPMLMLPSYYRYIESREKKTRRYYMCSAVYLN